MALATHKFLMVEPGSTGIIYFLHMKKYLGIKGRNMQKSNCLMRCRLILRCQIVESMFLPVRSAGGDSNWISQEGVPSGKWFLSGVCCLTCCLSLALGCSRQHHSCQTQGLFKGHGPLGRSVCHRCDPWGLWDAVTQNRGILSLLPAFLSPPATLISLQAGPDPGGVDGSVTSYLLEADCASWIRNLMARGWEGMGATDSHHSKSLLLPKVTPSQGAKQMRERAL